MPKEKKKSKGLMIAIIIASSIIVIIAASFGVYLYLHEMSNHRFVSQRRSGNFSFNNETLSQTAEFFNNNTNLQTLQSYCQQNMPYCEYYCTSINSENSLCSQLQLPQQPMNRSFYPMINYTNNGGAQ